MVKLSRAVFLSHTSEDTEAARRICEGLREAGIEVWFDQSDLSGGDVWDQKIRGQIRDCALFIPVISSNTQARLEGYFRREWKIAVDRTHDMADGRLFLLPVVIDETKDADAHVPESFRAVQWTRLPAGKVTAAFASRILALLPSGGPAGAPTGTMPSPTPETLRHPVDSHMERRGRRPKALAHWTAGIAAAAILALTGYALWRRAAPVATVPGNDSGSALPTTGVSRPRIAVLPFENLSPDPNNAFFTDGMHEEILTALANGVPGLDVISRTTMDTYRSRPVTAATLARELHCSYVLEGSMLREGNEVRLSLQLIDARTDTHLWARDFDRKLVNVMALESEVAAAVASQLSIKLGSTLLGQPRATDPVAFDLYLKARQLEQNADADALADSLQSAKSLLDQAVRIAPMFARAYVERIVVRVSQFTHNLDSSEANIAAATEDLEVAKKLAPQDSIVIAADAILAYAELDFDRSLLLFQAAESSGLADPNLLDSKASLLFDMARYSEDAELNRRLVALDLAWRHHPRRRVGVACQSRRPRSDRRSAGLAGLAHG